MSIDSLTKKRYISLDLEPGQRSTIGRRGEYELQMMMITCGGGSWVVRKNVITFGSLCLCRSTARLNRQPSRPNGPNGMAINGLL